MNARTGILGVVLVVVAVLLLIVLSGGEDGGEETAAGGNTIGNESRKGYGGGSATDDQAEKDEAKPKPQVPTIVIGADGEPVGGAAELGYDKGEQVRFKVESAVADEIHVHGYDISKDVEAGGTVEFDFPAELEGIYEAELEALGIPILELRVDP